jgi:hypothetical protein
LLKINSFFIFFIFLISIFIKIMIIKRNENRVQNMEFYGSSPCLTTNESVFDF